MKRGLKEQHAPQEDTNVEGYNRFPDEKGTERLLIPLFLHHPPLVTIVSPMKRGLKDLTPDSRARSLASVTIVSPMKRGLKAHVTPCRQAPIQVTIVSPMKRGLKGESEGLIQADIPCYNRFPDEKGTESPLHFAYHLHQRQLQSFPR